MAKRDAETALEEMDWRTQCRRPFRRVFQPYSPNAVTAAGGAERVNARRRSLGVLEIEDPAGEDVTAPPLKSLSDLELRPVWLKEALGKELKTLRPTQAQMLPILLAGLNAIVISSAVVGEEALMYLLLAALQACDQHPLTEEEPGPVCLILAAESESCSSITQSAQKLFQHSSSGKVPVRVANLSGGGSRSDKLREMSEKGAHVVVATPKRIHDMADKYQISLLRVTLLIVDGLDGMEAQTLKVLHNWIRPERQTLMLTRSWSPTLRELCGHLCLAGGLPVKVEMART